MKNWLVEKLPWLFHRHVYQDDEAEDWLHYAKIAVDRGVKRFAVPLFVLAIPVDFFVYPEEAPNLLVFRLGCINGGEIPPGQEANWYNWANMFILFTDGMIKKNR